MTPYATPSPLQPLCPCGTGRRYMACCGRLHDGAVAPDAHTLMRSRYSAYVLGRSDYLLATWHPSTRPESLAPDEPGLKWLGLDIRRQVLVSPDAATVEFVARYRVHGHAHRLHEISHFLREGGRWYYVSGDFPETLPATL